MLKYFMIIMLFALLALPPFFWRKYAYDNQAEMLRQRARRNRRSSALRILGLEGAPSPAEIREAHRRLMKRAHPDLGGSAELAAKINAAKDALLD